MSYYHHWGTVASEIKLFSLHHHCQDIKAPIYNHLPFLPQLCINTLNICLRQIITLGMKQEVILRSCPQEAGKV